MLRFSSGEMSFDMLYVEETAFVTVRFSLGEMSFDTLYIGEMSFDMLNVG